MARAPMPARLGIVASSTKVLIKHLKQFLEQNGKGEKPTKISGMHFGLGENYQNKTSLYFSQNPDMMDAIEVTIATLIEKEKYNALLEYWVQGGEIYWQQLYQDISKEQLPRRILAPTYPFKRNSFWPTI